jgi:hypothetical protein
MSKSVVIARRPQVCWRAFVEVETLCAWVPGLRKVQLITRAADGMPSEVRYEFSESRTYTLVYTYEADDISKVVRWEPKSGARDAVRGWARFEPHDGGTLMTYELEHGASRTEKEKFLDNVDEMLDAFARWMAESQERPSRRDLGPNQ